MNHLVYGWHMTHVVWQLCPRLESDVTPTSSTVQMLNAGEFYSLVFQKYQAVAMGRLAHFGLRRFARRRSEFRGCL